MVRGHKEREGSRLPVTNALKGIHLEATQSSIPTLQRSHGLISRSALREGQLQIFEGDGLGCELDNV